MMDFLDGLWFLYTDDEMCQTSAMGNLARNSVQIVRQLSPTMCIVRSAERYPSFDAHLLFLVFRIESEGSFTQCVRPIYAQNLQAAIDGPNDVWVTNNIWFKCEPLSSGDSQNFRLYVGGHVPSSDLNSVNRWLVEVLVGLVKAEVMITHEQPVVKVACPPVEHGRDTTVPSLGSASPPSLTRAHASMR